MTMLDPVGIMATSPVLAAAGSVHPLLWAALLICAVLVATVSVLRLQRWQNGAVSEPLPSVRPAALQTEAPALIPTTGPDPARGVNAVCSALAHWLTEERPAGDVWAAFDQTVREALGAHCEAVRVRCFRIDPGAGRLHPITQAGRLANPEGVPIAEGLLGHVASTGREFVAGARDLGPALERLALGEPEPWAWVWPVRVDGLTLGLVAIGTASRALLAEAELRRGLGAVLSLAWEQVVCRERLERAERTDRMTGVLTRTNFFELAAPALAESYTNHEPVVVVVLALEGLRRLDDGQCWRARDVVLERTGQALGSRVRSDDLVGRFADDRFVALLRRLDTALGKLIGEKLLGAVTAAAASVKEAGAQVQVRLGIAGSGLGQPDLDTLLAEAFTSVEWARTHHAAVGEVRMEGSRL